MHCNKNYTNYLYSWFKSTLCYNIIYRTDSLNIYRLVGSLFIALMYSRVAKVQLVGVIIIGPISYIASIMFKIRLDY